MSRRVGVILALLVVLAAIATAVATRFVEPIESTSAGYLSTEAHPSVHACDAAGPLALASIGGLG